jgi:hypothetical protein
MRISSQPRQTAYDRTWSTWRFPVKPVPASSRPIEVNPATNQIVWKYQEAFPQNFYSDRTSNAQRLPNGNTLINEGMFGRFFEVTSVGKVVWEYVNPYFGPASAAPAIQGNNVFRAYRYSEEEVAKARAA